MHADLSTMHEVIKAPDPKINRGKTHTLIALTGGTNYHSGAIKALIEM